MVLKRSLLLLTGCLLLAVPTPATAQNAAGLRGVVLDKDGSPVVSARVSIVNAATGVSQGAITDAKGEFRVVPLPPGRGYVIKVEFPGLATVSIPDVEVTAGRMTSLPVTLRPDTEMREHVKVVGTSEVVNPEQTTTQTNFSAEFIDALPILGRNYQDVLSLAPGVSDTDGDGNPNIHGARDTDVITLVDGVSTTDPYTGKVGQQLNIDSIQEIEVKTSGATAEFSRGQGGFVNIVTKSGGNEFEGRASFYWRSHILDGDGAGIDSPRLHGGVGEAGLRDLKFDDYLPFLSLSGPIRKDKAWYYFTAEYIQLQTPVNALTQAFVRGTKERRIFGKLSWDVSTNHKLVFTATVDPQEFTNLGLDSFTAIEAGYTDREGGTNLVLKETSIFTPNVFLETTVQHFDSKPARIPTLNADTNHNGVLFFDRNHNGFLEANERDPGEDFDKDGAWDVFETANLDRDHDGRTTPAGRASIDTTTSSTGGCEGIPIDPKTGSQYGPNVVGLGAEDKDCDGHLDTINEDDNGNHRLDPGEDRDGDGFLDPGGTTEDRNHNGLLDDRPFPRPGDAIPLDCQKDPSDPTGQAYFFPCRPAAPTSDVYPYPRFVPLLGDRDATQDQATLRANGPYFANYDRQNGRVTLRQDLTVFVPSWHGQHEMKFGGVVERENFSQTSSLRPLLLPHSRPAGLNARVSFLGVILPAENLVSNTATNTTFGMYLQDTYKPLPNLTIGLGVRFDREATDSFGYSPFDPVSERNLYNRLRGLGDLNGEPADDQKFGNNDGIHQQGFCSDPLFQGLCKTNSNAEIVSQIAALGTIARSRLTQHHIFTDLTAEGLTALFPDDAFQIDPVTGERTVRRDFLRTQGATFEQKEPFRLTNNNLAPRLSISWDPWGDSKTKVFLNWSRFFDKLFLSTVVPEEGPDTITRYYTQDQDGVNAGGVPDNGVGSVVTKAPPEASQVDRGLQTPFVDEMTFGFERELAPEVSLKITYINRKFRQQLQDKDINHVTRCCNASGQPLDQFGHLPDEAASKGGAGEQEPDGRPDLYIENFFFNQIFRIGNFNHARYKGIEVEVTKRLSRKWQLESSYTYSRAVGNAEDFQSNLGDDASSVPLQFGYLSYDQRHAVKFNAVTYLPGDWQLGAALSWTSGLPYSVIDRSFSLDNFGYPQTRTLFGRVANNAAGTFFSPVRRNSKRNPAAYNIDVAAHKSFVLGHFNSKLFITVENLLNSDTLTIFEYLPDNPDRSGDLQLDSERRFGRRFEIGFQFEF